MAKNIAISPTRFQKDEPVQVNGVGHGIVQGYDSGGYVIVLFNDGHEISYPEGLLEKIENVEISDPVEDVPQVKPGDPPTIRSRAVEIVRFLKSVSDVEPYIYNKGFIEGCYWSRFVTTAEYEWLMKRYGYDVRLSHE
jgi:DNA helicase HerA-like ATPase